MDLKIKDVAELLSISETTVRRWLTEGKIPAYRLNHQYRFNRTEIEDWVLKQRLNFGTPFGTTQEKREEPSCPTMGTMQFSLYRALYRGAVLPKVALKTKEGIIRHTMDYMANHFDLDADMLTELFLDREKLMATALNNGIGVPHTRDFLLNTLFDVVVAVFPEEPIEYGALDGQPVHTLFFLFANDGKNHLHLLAKVAHLSSNEKSSAFFRTHPSKERLLEYVKHWESSLNI